MYNLIRQFSYSVTTEVISNKVFHLAWPFFNREKAVEEWKSFIKDCSSSYPYTLLWINSDVLRDLDGEWEIMPLSMVDGFLIASKDALRILTEAISTDGWFAFFAKTPFSPKISFQRQSNEENEILKIMTNIQADVAVCSAFDDSHRAIYIR